MSISRFVSDLFLAGLALVLLAVAGYLSGLSVRDSLPRSRSWHEKQRHRLRREFWGYD